jgi:hypothetical protein
MHIFSKYIYMGNIEVPFENNEIKIIHKLERNIKIGKRFN